MPDVYVGVGSNTEPERHLLDAVAALERRFGALRVSSVYSSPAAGMPAADYSNMAVGFASDDSADAVKAALRSIEDGAGRTRSGPRPAACTLDLDLLIYGRRVDAERSLPHVDILRRSFVLAPLAELAPRLPHPLTGEVLADAWRALARDGPELRRLGALRAGGG